MNKRKFDLLIVDDDPINCALLTDAAKQLGLKYACANNGLEALNCLERISVRCVVTDVEMPIMDGVELTREIRARISDTLPIISMSAKDSIQMQMDLIDSGVTMFFSKPFNLDALFQGMSKHVGSAI